MELEEVRQLVKLVEESGIEELELSRKGTTIRIQKSRPQDNGAATEGRAVVNLPAAAPPPAVAGPPPAAAAPAPVEADRGQDKWKEVRSPIVGTFYRAPAPEADPFVRVGDRVSPGQTLCIVEAMKVMNEIEAEFPGVVREILVENASPVEAESVLFLVEPA